MVDLIGRLFVIERQEALRWGYDPAAAVVKTASVESGGSEDTRHQSTGGGDKEPGVGQVEGRVEPGDSEKRTSADIRPASAAVDSPDHVAGIGTVSEIVYTDTTLQPVELPPAEDTTTARPQNNRSTSLIGVIIRLGRSPRALTALFDTLVYGSVLYFSPCCWHRVLIGLAPAADLCTAAKSPRCRCICRSCGDSTQRRSGLSTSPQWCQ